MGQHPTIEAALNARASTKDRIRSAQAQYYVVTAEIDVIGAGEAVVDVTFPVYFVDKPKHYKGGELQSGESFTTGSFPTTDIVILQWDTRLRDDGTAVYSGATIGIVTTGIPGQLSTVQFHAEGIGIRQTTSDATAADDAPGVYVPGTVPGTIPGVVPPGAVPPGAPIIGSPTVSLQTVTIHFLAPTSTGGSAITLYTATATSSTGGSTRVVTGPSSPIVMTNLGAAETYTVTVRATNLAGTGPASAASGSFTTGTNPNVSGGAANIRSKIGSQQGLRIYETSTTNRWNSAAQPVGQSINWHWNFETTVETDGSIAGQNWNFVGAPQTVFRVSGPLSAFDSGSRDGDMATDAGHLAALYTAQGNVPQLLRPFYEWDSNWMTWGIGDSYDTTTFIRVFKRVVNAFRAVHPQVKVSLCGDLGYGDGTGHGNVFAHAHALWDTVLTGLAGYVDYLDVDCYSNGPPANVEGNGLNWLVNELEMIKQVAIAHGVQIAHGEWGIGDPNLSQSPHNWDAVVWTQTFLNWWASLPATGPGSLGHIELFDVGFYQGQLPDGRAVIAVPNPTSNPDGLRCASTIKQFLAA